MCHLAGQGFGEEFGCGKRRIENAAVAARPVTLGSAKFHTMATGKITIPSFSSERAEAAWWDQNRAAVEADLRVVLREKKKAPPRVIMTPGYKRKFVPVPVTLTGNDLDAARKIAEDRGIAYQTYLARLLK